MNQTKSDELDSQLALFAQEMQNDTYQEILKERTLHLKNEQQTLKNRMEALKAKRAVYQPSTQNATAKPQSTAQKNTETTVQEADLSWRSKGIHALDS
jgi:hypothetical protein